MWTISPFDGHLGFKVYSPRCAQNRSWRSPKSTRSPGISAGLGSALPQGPRDEHPAELSVCVCIHIDVYNLHIHTLSIYLVIYLSICVFIGSYVYLFIDLFVDSFLCVFFI